jgi:hypothetical protein
MQCQSDLMWRIHFPGKLQSPFVILHRFFIVCNVEMVFANIGVIQIKIILIIQFFGDSFGPFQVSIAYFILFNFSKLLP